MLKKQITYNDLDGNPITEEFYFNLTVAECTKMELGENGVTMSEQLEKIIQSNDGAQILDAMENIVRKAYGVRSDDGKRLIKSNELWTEFTQTEAWSALFTEIAYNAERSAEFFQALLPAEVVAQMGNEKTANASALRSVQDVPLPNKGKQKRMSREEILAGMKAKTAPRVLTYSDIVSMSEAELEAALDAGAVLDDSE